MKDYYFELGVAPSDERETIRKAFTAKQKSMHRLPEKDQRALIAAWQVINNEDTRKEYDAQNQFQIRKTSPRFEAIGKKKTKTERVPFRWGVPLMEIIMMPFKKEEEAPKETPEEKANLHFTQGVLYAGENKTLAQAKSEFQEVLSIIPDLREAQYNLALVCYKMGDFKEALELFKKYVNEEGRDMFAKKMVSLLEG